jgi:hypothetical protein
MSGHVNPLACVDNVTASDAENILQHEQLGPIDVNSEAKLVSLSFRLDKPSGL